MRPTVEPANKKPRAFLWLVLIAVCLLSALTYTGALACGWGSNSSPQSTVYAHGCMSWMQQSQNCASPTAISCNSAGAQSQICVLPTSTIQPCGSMTAQDPACTAPTPTVVATSTFVPIATTSVAAPTAQPCASVTAQDPACASPVATASPVSTASSSYTLNVVNPGNLISSTLVTQLQSVFQYSYPKLVQRFGSASSPQNVTLTVSPTISSNDAAPGSVTVADTIGSHITLNAAFQDQFPTYLGWLTHELTHVVQGYTIQEDTTSNVPEWFVEGMAEYGRYYYAPPGANPPQFAVLNAPTTADTAPKPYTTAARFLIWLQQRRSSTIVDQLNKAVQTGQDFTSTFQQIAGGTVDQVWSQYVVDPAIS